MGTNKARITISLKKEIESWIIAASIRSNKSKSEIVVQCLDEFIKLYPNRFSRSDKARAKSEDAWKTST